MTSPRSTYLDAAGFEMHLTKPVNPRTLDQILTDLTARVL